MFRSKGFALCYFHLSQRIVISFCTHQIFHSLLSSYLEGILVTAKRGIAGVIIALGNDEELDPFTKYLMFTHMYTPEQVKEIGHEEIYRRQQKFKEDELNGI